MMNSRRKRKVVTVPTALKNFDWLPDSANVKEPVVCGLLDCSSATVRRRVKDGGLPQPLRLGEMTFWNVGELRKVLASLKASAISRDPEFGIDDYANLLREWVQKRREEFTVTDIATQCLKLNASELTRYVQTRIGMALRRLGCTRIEKRTHALTRFWYTPPTL